MKRLMILFILFYGVVVSESQPKVTGLQGWDIILDPGHSRKENMGVLNYSEAQKVLRVGWALRDLLLNTTDIDTVYMTRTDETQVVSLSQRTDLANSLGTAWYHSIHSDASSSPSTNTTLLLWGMYSNGQEKNPPGGQAMSDIMIGNLTRGYRTTTVKGSIGDCKFYGCSGSGPYLHVNRETNMPSELSEAGYHTNPRQNQLNMNDDWKKLEAYTFYWSILAYHHVARPPVHILTGIVTDLESGLPVNGAIITVDTFYYKTDTYESLFHLYSQDPEQLHNGFYFFDNEALPSAGTMYVSADHFEPQTLSFTMVDTFFSYQDVKLVSTLPPHVDAASPSANQTDVMINSKIEITFNRPVERTLLEQHWKLEPAVNGKFSWNGNSTNVKFTPDSLAAETLYKLTIPAEVTDLYGHAFDGNADSVAGDDYSLQFTTGVADIFAPDIASIYPADKDSTSLLQPAINLVFDEDLDVTTVADTSITFDLLPDGTPVAADRFYYSINRRGIISLFPHEKLQPLTQYRIKLFPGIADPLGNTMNRSRRSVFYTRNQDDQITRIESFENGSISNWWKPQSSGSTVGIVTDSTTSGADSVCYVPIDQDHVGCKLDYGWDTLAGDWLIRVYLSGGAPRNIYFTTDKILQVYILGDSSLNQFRFALDEADKHEVSPWYTIDWYGWRLVEWDLSRGETGTWPNESGIPLGDGVLSGQLRFDSFQFRYQPGARPFGSLVLDDLQLASRYPVAISENETRLPESSCFLNSYPNPFNHNIQLEFFLAESGSVGYSVYNLLGEKVADLGNTWLNRGVHHYLFQPDHLPAGVYFFNLSLDQNRNLTRKIVYLK
ncbi:MAG: Ig-like domain-containing protein [Candidatus Delongbacteria bacterium]|nr:Ig-like domain-containing protein [Candidatus Delongbacteria bacterium]